MVTTLCCAFAWCCVADQVFDEIPAQACEQGLRMPAGGEDLRVLGSLGGYRDRLDLAHDVDHADRLGHGAFDAAFSGSPASRSMSRISFTDFSMRSVPSLDSALPRWIRTAATTTNEKSWRNSDCQFSSVDCPNSTQKSEKRAAWPCAACW